MIEERKRDMVLNRLKPGILTLKAWSSIDQGFFKALFRTQVRQETRRLGLLCSQSQIKTWGILNLNPVSASTCPVVQAKSLNLGQL